MLTALLSLALAPALATTGPHTVGWNDLAFDDVHHDQGTVYGRVYFPALGEGEQAEPDTTAGPFPLVAQLHGWLGQAWMYDAFCLELASWGFVVAATDTETGANLDMHEFAWDTRALIDHVEQEARDGDGFLAGLLDEGPLSAVGHSMGGATLGLLIDIEPRVAHVVAVMPYTGARDYYDNVAAFTGSALYVTGDEDETATPDMVEEWFAHVAQARRGLFFAIEGAGHQAITDFQWDQETMDDQTQLEAVQHLATRFLRAEVHGEQDLYRDLIGPGADHIPHVVRSNSQDPAIWATHDEDGRISVGVAGPLGGALDLHLASAPPLQDAALDGLSLDSETPTLADAPLPEGVTQVTLDAPADAGDGLYLQGISIIEAQERFTRVVELVPGQDPSSGSNPESAGGRLDGCSTTPGRSTPWLALAALALGWRRSRTRSGSDRASATLAP